MLQDVHSREFPSTAVLDLVQLRTCVQERSGQCPRSIYVRILALSGPLRFAQDRSIQEQVRSGLLLTLHYECRTRIEKLPPDLIWPEWFSGHGPRTMANRRRPMAAYKYNLLEHIGTVSSFTVRVDRPSFPRCYESMADVWSLAKAERFQVMPCCLSQGTHALRNVQLC